MTYTFLLNLTNTRCALEQVRRRSDHQRLPVHQQLTLLALSATVDNRVIDFCGLCV